MTRRTTTSVQLSGYRWLIRRIETAITRGDIWETKQPQSTQTLCFALGIFFACLIPAAGFVKSIFVQRADRGSAEMIITKSGGGPYVMFDDGSGMGLHKTTNLASARLIVGKADAPKIVKDEALAKEPRRADMGIPDGPDNLATRADDTALWAVCDRHTDDSQLSLTKTDVLSTTLFAGTDSMTNAVTAMPSTDAILVKLDGSTDGVQWVVYKGKRASVGPQDGATRAALGLSPAQVKNAIPISAGLFNAIPAAPALTTPFIADRGRVNPALPDVLNGDVIITASADATRQYWVALPGGVQQVSELVAQMLLYTGSKEITNMDRATVAAVPLVSDIDPSRYPDRAPNFRQPHVLCWSWSKGLRDMAATTTVLTGESLPISADNQHIPTPIPATKPPETTAQASYMRPGQGWYVRVTDASPQSHAAQGFMFIEDTGKRYFIGPDEQNRYDKVLSALGIAGREPQPIPWEIAKLYGPGSTLSMQAALVVHGQMGDDLNQKAAHPPDGVPAAAAEGN